MKILYRQSINGERKADILSFHGINNCFFKSIKLTACDGTHTKKRHSHNGFEFHIMLDGSQVYETDNGRFLLDGGKILAVPKRVPHALIFASYPMVKYALTFTLEDSLFDSESLNDCILFDVPERILSNICTTEELQKNDLLGSVFTENAVFESVCILLNEIGVSYKVANIPTECVPKEKTSDERVELAIQFIKDNVETPLQVGEVASYCYISEKQLNRLFLRETGATVAAYIRRERIKKIEELLTCTGMSLSEISEKFEFPSEHGFNIFFKKYNGMPPGEYRKMTKNGKE